MVELHRVLEENSICRTPLNLTNYTQEDVRDPLMNTFMLVPSDSGPIAVLLARQSFGSKTYCTTVQSLLAERIPAKRRSEIKNEER